MPLSTFDGESTEELHEHYDRDGNLTGTTVTTAPGWSDEDRAWALGLALREAIECPRGHDLAEQLVEGFADEWKFVPQPAITCLACVAQDAAIKADQKDPNHRAMFRSVVKVPRKQAKRSTNRRG